MLIDATTGYVAPKATKRAVSDFKKQEADRAAAKNIRFAAFVMVAATVCFIGYKVLSALPM